MNSIETRYARWLACAPEWHAELTAMTPAQREDAFYREMTFGTGGLRGIMGVGTNRMNDRMVAWASQGLADYVNAQYAPDARKIAVSYDSRHHSESFARVSACVFAANGIRVSLFRQLMPTPCLSFATRALSCAAGVMITASHNPADYNGYKVYGADGCQITTQKAADIFSAMEKHDVFDDVKTMDFQAALAAGMITWIPDAVYDGFTAEVLRQSVLFGDNADRTVSVVYSPLNGTGFRPVTRVLREAGFTGVTVVAEQEQPDGDFKTCQSPNPELPEAMTLAIRCAREREAALVIATDPDCDRTGVAVRDGDDYRLLSGNEVGLLLLDYVCSQRVRHGMMPPDPVMCKTIVTMDLAEQIAAHYGVRTVNVLTGFKFIGEQIGLLEAAGKTDSFVFGFEESCGYLSGTYVRDKDGVNAAFLVCEMAAFYAARGITLAEKLDELYATYGRCLNTLHAYRFEGADGLSKMRTIMSSFRQGISDLGGHRVLRCLDYSKGLDGLPRSDALKLHLPCGSVVLRPSGTEPKLKAYISVMAQTLAGADAAEHAIGSGLEHLISRTV